MEEELEFIFNRDLDRLKSELNLFPSEESIWEIKPGVANSAGNLILHIVGNMRHYLGMEMAGIAYQRDREQEFNAKNVSREELLALIEKAKEAVNKTLKTMQPGFLEEKSHKHMLPDSTSNRLFFLHLIGHLSYHLGQINYLRRILNEKG